MLNPAQFGKIEIPRFKVLARLGYASGRTGIDPATDDDVRKGIETAGRLLAPRQVTASAPIRRAGGDSLLLEPGLRIDSRDIARLLEGCAAAFGFAVTIGPALEVKRNALLEERRTGEALILDAAGSVAAEELAAVTHRQIEEEATADGGTATRRFSPGYGDWALTGQKDFLEWLGADRIGIRLTESFQMLPEKSVSALLGVTPIR